MPGVPGVEMWRMSHVTQCTIDSDDGMEVRWGGSLQKDILLRRFIFLFTLVNGECQQTLFKVCVVPI
jgi:hypothetical protein